MIRLKKRKNLSVGIMISPMIDMSFLLLVFFIVSTMNMNEVKTPVSYTHLTLPTIA